MITFISSLSQYGKTIVTVPSITRIRSASNLNSVLPEIDLAGVKMILELSKITVGADLQEAAKTISKYRLLASAVAPEPYKFSNKYKPDANYTEFSFPNTSIRMKSGWDTLSMSNVVAKDLWAWASTYWQTGENIRTDQTNRTIERRRVVISENFLSIGCKNFEREKIEWIAVKMGWI